MKALFVIGALVVLLNLAPPSAHAQAVTSPTATLMEVNTGTGDQTDDSGDYIHHGWPIVKNVDH